MLEIHADTLEKIRSSPEEFIKFFEDYAFYFALNNARLVPIFSRPRLMDVRHFWTEDLRRLQFSLGNDVIPDHYKQAAHLAYWIRRQGPILEYKDLDNRNDWPNSLTASERKVRDLLICYSSEYPAFDLGYRICWFYEVGRLENGPGNPRVKAFYLDEDYIGAMCCFLKEKNVSPHALYLIYKSLFYRRFAE